MDRAGTTRREALFDLAVALAFAAISVLLTLDLVDDAAHRAVGIALGLAHTLPLAVRRRWPLAVLAAMAVTAVLTIPAGLPIIILGPAVVVGVYTVGAQVDPPRSIQALVAVLVVMTGVVLVDGADAGTVVGNGLATTAVWWLGDRARRAAQATAAERAKAAAEARRAALDERLRIARELHDVVAHAMSVIAVQAGTGRFVIERSPEVAAEALATIETTSRDALQEMRRLLAVLRDDDAVADEVLLPAPGLDDLDDLVVATRDAGVDVQLETAGTPVPLPAGLCLSAYRIVQEALTNVRKHAGATHATVRVTYEPDALRVEVADDGSGAHGDGAAGHGLLGMQERVALYGGTLAAGPVDGAGFRVAATFPIGAPS